MQQDFESTHPFPTGNATTDPARAGMDPSKGNGASDAGGTGVREQLDRAKQTVSKALTTVQDQTVAMTDSFAHRIQRRPLTAVAIAAVAGFALGLACVGASQLSTGASLRSLRSRMHW